MDLERKSSEVYEKIEDFKRQIKECDEQTL